MLNLSRLRLTCILALALTGCRHDDPYFCENAPHHNCLAIDARTGCTGDGDCHAPEGVCDLQGTMMCVQCTASKQDACVEMTPTCGDDHTCRACVAHAECPASHACLPNGACGTDSTVAYVDPAGDDNNACTRAAPCIKISKALATGLPYIKLQGTTQETGPVSISDQNVTLLADPGARLTRVNNGLILEVKGSSHVTIYDLEVTGGSSSTGVGISLPTGNTATLELHRARLTQNTAGGISATGGTITVSQSTISGNQGGGISATGGIVTISQSTVSGNQGGGISLTGAGTSFKLTNNFIYRNGDIDNSTFGGINLAVAGGASSRLEFNTIVDNHASTGQTHAGGIICDFAFAAPNNLIARNSVGLSATDANSQTVGICGFPTSTIASSVAGMLFVSSETSPFDYHLMIGSSVIDQATTASTVDIDFDGNHRPQGAASDRGADELKQ